MRVIKTTEAIGHILCHDITQIVKDVTKGVAFKKGHVVKEEDIPVLLSLGKDNLYVWEKKEGMLHENDAAEILKDICKGEHIRFSEPKEGKIDLFAEVDGVLKIDVERLNQINELDDIIIATRHNNFPVKAGDKLVGTRVIPLIIEEEKMKKAQEIGANQPLLTLLPYRPMKVGIVTTGNEVYHGRIKDTFTPVIKAKVEKFGLEVIAHEIVYDDTEMIKGAIDKVLARGVDMVICTGGMSVDPDDLTPAAIKATGAEIVTYGAPVLPGAMFLLAYYNGTTPIMGLPGCVMYAKSTIFDLVLPRVVAGEKVTKKDLAHLGHGGLCLDCPTCVYPHCSFGKGV